jgi:hypothetical protein
VCCLIAVLVFLGPRAGILVWWLLDMPRWERTFDTFVWPLLGAIFLPWTLLAYVWVFPFGITGFDWFWLALGLILDISFYASGGFRRRWRR